MYFLKHMTIPINYAFKCSSNLVKPFTLVASFVHMITHCCKLKLASQNDKITTSSCFCLVSDEVTRCKRNGWSHARRYSDLAFGFSMTAFVSTILIIVFVYATDAFPRSAYFCRQDVIDGADIIREYCTD